MEQVKRARSLPVLFSGEPPASCESLCSAGIRVSDHLLHVETMSQREECNAIKPQTSSYSRSMQSYAATSWSASPGAAGTTCTRHLDTVRENDRNNSLSLQSDCEAEREEAVIASHPNAARKEDEDDDESSRQMCVKESASVIQLRQQQQYIISSLLAATSAATLIRSASGTDLLSSRNKKMSLTDREERSSSDVSCQQVPEASSASTSSPEHLTDSDFEELYFQDNLILKELSEMRQILQKLLEQNKELSLITSPLVADDDILSAVLGLRSAADASESRRSSSTSLVTMASDSSLESATIKTTNALSEAIPHFPVGNYELIECSICLTSKWMHRRACCSLPACAECLTSYYASRVDLGQVSIECISSSCRCFVHRDEISLLLPMCKKTIYRTLLANSNSDSLSKTCPRCNQVLKLESASVLKSMERAARKNPAAVQVMCKQCSYCWCFPCASPWHEGISCRQYLKGDRLLQEWAKKMHQGQVNAQKCPKCKILIQKSSGCDHMHCPRCKTDFCYRCGDSLRRLKFFGDHYSKLSVFGCKYRYKAGQPVQRKLIRGAVFASKLMMAPVLGSLALVAGAVVVGVGVAALPLYGGMRLYRKYQHIALNRNPFQVSAADSIPTARDTVSTAAQTVRIAFMADSYVDEIESVPGMR